MRKNMGSRLFSFILITTLMISSVLVMPACSSEPAQPLQSIEVRDYQGQQLSSIKDVQEVSIKGKQLIDKSKYRLEISGLVEKPVKLSYDQILNENGHYQKVVKLWCVDDWTATILWEGVLVSDLVNRARVLPEAKIMIFHAQDGYTTSLPVEYILDKNIILAYKMNDVIISPERGFPFQLVAENKWGYKWIKWVTKIELSDDVNYRGYWEENGYANNGDTTNDFLERFQR